MSALAAPLEAMDAAVRRAVLEHERWEDALTTAPFDPAVLTRAPLARHRPVAGQAVFDALEERMVVTQEIPLRDALRRWVGVLTALRVTEDDRAEEARVEWDARHEVRLELLEKTSVRAGLKGLLGAPNVAMAHAWLNALAEGSPSVAAAHRERASKEAEVVRRLGFASRTELSGGPAPGKLEELARTFLRETGDLAGALRQERGRRGGAAGVVSEILQARALDAPEGWPGKLTPQSLMDALRAPSDIARGVQLKVAMPSVFGASSFALALTRFGEAYRRAMAGATREPFVLAVPPWFVDAHRYGFVFGSLPSTEVYYQRALGLSSRVASQQARTLARTALMHARLVATACLLAPGVVRPDIAEHEARTADLYGMPLSPSFAGAFPRMKDVHARILALLTTLPFLEQLRDQFDEDWFRNPRAWVFLRVRAAGSSVPPGADDHPDPHALARAFEKALG